MILTHHYETSIHWQELFLLRRRQQACEPAEHGAIPENSETINQAAFPAQNAPSKLATKQADERKSTEDLCNPNSAREEIPNQNLHWNNKKGI